MFEFMTLPRPKRTKREKIKRFLSTLAPALLLAGLWGGVIEPDTLITPHSDFTLGDAQVSGVVRASTLGGGQAPVAFEQSGALRIAVISDLHVGSPWIDLKKVADVVATTNAQNPDLILLAGDYLITGVVGGSYTDPAVFAPILGGLRAKYGVYAVLGNHDHWEDAQGVTDAFTAAGITMLENKTQTLSHQGQNILLAGIGTFGEGKHDLKLIADLQNEVRPVIVFTHNPDLFALLPDTVDLAIGGHTHGYQMSTPYLGWPFVPPSDGQGYGRGIEMVGTMATFVSPGVGTSAFPFRFGRAPEISILNIQQENSGLQALAN